MPEAAKKIIEFAFNDLNLNRVEAYAATENTASNTVLKKVGFTLEGTKRKALKAKATGIVHDANLYGLLKEDFK